MIRAGILILALSALLACQDRPTGTGGTEHRSAGGGGAALPALSASPLYRHFAGLYPGKEALVWAFRDVDNDGRDDLILIYRVDKDRNAMRVVLDGRGAYAVTNEVPAPVSHQVITFKDIDKKPPLEFVVQGMKGTKIGFAVYRIEKGKLVDLFGEGMDECC